MTVIVKRLSPKAIQALKEAVASIYWTKRDFRGFLTHSITDAQILARCRLDADQKGHRGAGCRSIGGTPGSAGYPLLGR